MLAYSPLSTVAIACAHTQLGAVLAGAAADGVSRIDVAKALEVDEPTAGYVLDELLSARVLVTSEEAEAEVSTAPMGLWSPEELWLHDRTRPQRHAAPIGATHRFRGVLEPEPVQTGGPTARRTIALPAPAARPAGAAPDSLAAVMSRRRSVRRQDDTRPITAAQLGEFLHRVQRLEPSATGDADGLETGRRPYPGAGGIGELEIYPLVSRCAGWRAGSTTTTRDGTGWRPWPPRAPRPRRCCRSPAPRPPCRPAAGVVRDHRTDRAPDVEVRGNPVRAGAQGRRNPDRVDVPGRHRHGAGPCALGAGDVASFAALSGLDTLVEPAIAEFVLGSCPSDCEEQP